MRVKLLVISILFLLTLAFLGNFHKSYASEWGFIAGGVFDSSDGHALVKAIVTATGNGYTITKKTNAYGYWGMSLPQQGYYTVTFSKPRYITQTLIMYAGSSAGVTETFLIRK